MSSFVLPSGVKSDTAAGAPAAPSGTAPAAAAPQAALPAQSDQFVHPNGITVRIENMVATAYLNIKLDLQTIAKKAKNIEYSPRRFSAAILRMREPRTTALIFASGKIVLMGAKSEDNARLAARRVVSTITKVGFDTAKMEKFQVHNVVGCTDVNFKINLEQLRAEHSNFCTYNPEVFPGLSYRIKEPEVVLLIFHSGKVVLTKAKTREQVNTAFGNIYAVLENYRES